jgi:hypothetical protein
VEAKAETVEREMKLLKEAMQQAREGEQAEFSRMPPLPALFRAATDQAERTAIHLLARRDCRNRGDGWARARPACCFKRRHRRWRSRLPTRGPGWPDGSLIQRIPSLRV